MARKLLTGAAVFGLVCAAAACEDPTSAETDRTRVLVHFMASGVTGAAGDLALADATAEHVVSAVVTVAGVYLQAGEGEPEQGPGRVWLTEESFTVDLFELLDEAAMLLADAEIPAGSYAQLRLILSGGYLEVEHPTLGTQYYATSPDYHALPAEVDAAGTLVMPSMAQTGLKVNFPGAIALLEDEEQLPIDFDVWESLGHQAGASGMWIMDPVIMGSRITE